VRSCRHFTAARSAIAFSGGLSATAWSHLAETFSHFADATGLGVSLPHSNIRLALNHDNLARCCSSHLVLFAASSKATSFPNKAMKPDSAGSTFDVGAANIAISHSLVHTDLICADIVAPHSFSTTLSEHNGVAKHRRKSTEQGDQVVFSVVCHQYTTYGNDLHVVEPWLTSFNKPLNNYTRMLSNS